MDSESSDGTASRRSFKRAAGRFFTLTAGVRPAAVALAAR
jgi:hypothetical protein